MITNIILMWLLGLIAFIVGLIFWIKIYKKLPLVKYNPALISILAFIVLAILYYPVFTKPQFITYLSVCFCISFFLYLVCKSSDKPLPVEQGKIPLYEEKCWAGLYQKKWYRRVNSKDPIARFALYDTFMVVKFSWHQLCLKYTEIDKVKLEDTQRGMQKLSIYYHCNNESDYMVLLLENALQAKGIIESKIQS